MDRLRLEPPTLSRKDDALDFLREFKEENVHPYGTNKLYSILNEGGRFKTYEDWLESCEKDSSIPLGSFRGLLRRTYFLVRERDNRIVGMVDIRLELDYRYWNDGGNIGYCIRKSERHKGYNKINLYLALKVCHEYGVEAVLLGCEENNLGSSRTIRALGGKLLREYWSDIYCVMDQFFVIDVDSAVKKYFYKYRDKIC